MAEARRNAVKGSGSKGGLEFLGNPVLLLAYSKATGMSGENSLWPP